MCYVLKCVGWCRFLYISYSSVVAVGTNKERFTTEQSPPVDLSLEELTEEEPRKKWKKRRNRRKAASQLCVILRVFLYA